MTVNVVYASTSDGYLTSTNANYTTARNGGTFAANTGSNTGYYGQNNNGGTYAIAETFLAFSYPAIAATDMITCAYLRTWSLAQRSTGVARDMEIRGDTWQAGGLTSADWATPTALGAARLDGVVKSVQGSLGKFTLAGSDEMLAAVAASSSMEFVITSSRQRAGNVPTADEWSAIALADEAGTTYDPALVWTTVPRSQVIPAASAAVQTSGGHAYLYTNGTPASVIYLRHRHDDGGSHTMSLPIGTSPGFFDLGVAGAQGFAVVVDENDHLYVIGKSGAAENALCVRAFTRNVPAWTWTALATYQVSLPAYDTAVNNIAATYHRTAGGTIMVAVGHTAGQGVSGGGGNELAYVLLSAEAMRTGSGTLTRGSGTMLGTLQPAVAPAAFNDFANPVGSGLDVVADLVQPDWGYVTSFRKNQELGANSAAYVGRYILNATGTGFTHTSTHQSGAYGVKDASAKLRLVPVGDGQVALITADSDVGFGLYVNILQAQGSTPGLVRLGAAGLAGEAANIPDGPAIAGQLWWDAVYSSAENSLWIYYRHASDATKVMRTRFSLSTYQPTGQEIQAYSGSTVQAVRTSRNAVGTTRTRVVVAVTSGGVQDLAEVLDTFNLAPTAPVLTPRANYDAAAAATFVWTFTDPNIGDTQSAYDFEVQRTDTDAVVVSTGKTTSATASRAVSGGTLTNDLGYRWRVRTWDASDTVGPWSDWGTFSTSAGGAVTITDPATDNPPDLMTDEVQVSWSVSGTTQASYRVILKRNDTGATVSDTGWVVSAATQLLLAGMVTGVEHTVSVQVRNGASVSSGIGTRLLTPDYGTPEAPVLQVQPVPEEGYVLVSVDNPLSGQPSLGTVERDFEDGTTTGWTPTSATVENSAEQAHGGTRSLKITSTGTPTQAYARISSITFGATLTPTERYTARMWVWSATERQVAASMDWITAGGAYLSTTAATTTVPASAWTEIQVTGTCPDTAARVSFGPTITGNPATGTVIYVDDVIIVSASDRPEVDRNLILRRAAGTSDPWVVVGEIEPDGVLRDYTAPGQTPVQYMVRGIAE